MAKDNLEPTTADRLRFFKSPLVSEDKQQSVEQPVEGSDLDLGMLEDKNGTQSNYPQSQKHENASLLELFFDLFFAANYTVFSQTQGVDGDERFKSYLGYFCVLWTTWLLVCLYDVRFVIDSIFERAARSVHLAVMVGFAVVAPNFNPFDQNLKIMRTMSTILAVSRLCLAVEYTGILWHIRKYRSQRVPVLMQIAFNLFSSMIYLGVTFCFKDGYSRVFVTWYAIPCLEVVLTFAIAYLWPIMSFTGTHLMQRISLLTILFLGEGIIAVAENVVTIVKSPDAWNSQTIGIPTAAVTTIYFVFLVYFDWMKHSHLPAVRLQLWTCLHFPFHLALVLFMQGFTQFVIWSKIINILTSLDFNPSFDLSKGIGLAEATSKVVYNHLCNITDDYFVTYPPRYYSTWQSVQESLITISELPDTFWPQLIEFIETGYKSNSPPPQWDTFHQAFLAISAAMENALMGTFGIDLVREVAEEEGDSVDIQGVGLEFRVNQATWDRFFLVCTHTWQYSYAYIAAGASLILMTALTIVSRLTPWNRWDVTRTLLFLLLGTGTSLVSLLCYNPDQASKFQESPWLLPTICLVWVLVLFLTHTRNTSPSFSSSRARDDTAYGPVVITTRADIPTE